MEASLTKIWCKNPSSPAPTEGWRHIGHTLSEAVSLFYIFSPLSFKECRRNSVGQWKALSFGKLGFCIQINHSPEWWPFQGMKDCWNDRLSPVFLRWWSSGKCVIISEFPKVPLFNIMFWHTEGTVPDMKCKSIPLPPLLVSGLIMQIEYSSRYFEKGFRWSLRHILV